MNHLLLPSPLTLLHRPSNSKPLLLHTPYRRRYSPNAAPDGNSGDTSTAAASEPSTDAPPSAAPSSSKPTSVKDRLRSRNQSRRVQEAYLPPVEVRMMKGKEKRNDSAALRREKPPQRRRKEWDEMSLGEKALELYVGEKGALFWLNKFAYASIFIMAGAWILFRFVGPATGLYQLDAPPLAPTDVLRGS